MLLGQLMRAHLGRVRAAIAALTAGLVHPAAVDLVDRDDMRQLHFHAICPALSDEENAVMNRFISGLCQGQ